MTDPNAAPAAALAADPAVDPSTDMASRQSAGASSSDRLIPDKQAEILKEAFKKLEHPVRLELFTDDGHNPQHNRFTQLLLRELSRLSPLIILREHGPDSEAATGYGVSHFPTILFNPGEYRIRYTGAPTGEETKTLLETIFMISRRRSGLSQTAAALLDELDTPRNIKVFVTPTCPYCPGQVMNAYKAAMHRPDLVSAECVETDEFPEIASRYNVGSVPQTTINDTLTLIGLEPELRFIFELKSLKDFAETDNKASDSQDGSPEVTVCDLVVVGAGPAGLTAAIYAKRSGLTAVVLEKSVVGGQVALTPMVENYPGFSQIAGVALMDMIAAQARQYADIRVGEPVEEIKIGKSIEVLTPGGRYLARAVILATGATWRKLDVPGETGLFGKGVTYCATCDGYMFRNRRAVIIGGGNTALTDALHLKNLGAEVTIIHRRDAFRAEKHLQDAVAAQDIPVIWNTTVTAINGETAVTSVTLKDLQTGAEREFPTDGALIAIGESPNKALAEQLGLELDGHGFVKTTSTGRTSIPRVYAAGDITGGVRQIVTAVGQGASAALAVFEDLNHPYWKR